MIRTIKLIIRVVVTLGSISGGCWLAYTIFKTYWENILIAVGFLVAILIVAWAFDY